VKRPVLSAPECLLEPRRLLRRILDLAMEATGASSGSLMLLNPNTGALDIEVSRGLGAKARRAKLRPGEGVTGWVAGTGRSVRLDDVRGDRRYVQLNPRVRSELAVPLLLRDQVVGILNVDHTRPAAFTRAHEQELTRLAESAAGWIRIAWEISQYRIRGEQLETLVDMGQLIISQDNLENVLRWVARETRRLMKARLCSLMLLDGEGRELELKAWHGASEAYIRKPNLVVAESLVGVAVRRLRPVSVLNVQQHAQYQQTELAREEGLCSLLAVPLVFGERAMGVLCVYTGQPHRFANEEIRLLKAMAGLSAVAIAKAQLLERIVDAEEKQKASERLSALGWLAAEIAHEIRNPLAVVQLLFHAMMEEWRPEGAAARDAALIEDKMRQMNQILERTLNFARSAEPEFQDLDAARILEDLSLLIRLKLAEQRVEIRLKQAAAPLRFRGDRAQVEQAILNVVMNACQAMPGGGVLTLSGAQQAHRGRDWVVLRVRDTGEGMPRERVESLFQPFLSHRKGGTGIGLVLVKKTMEVHGGRIQVRSTPGKGSRIELWFPADGGAPSADQ
jgi:signal transduction histidine kinase